MDIPSPRNFGLRERRPPFGELDFQALDDRKTRVVLNGMWYVDITHDDIPGMLANPEQLKQSIDPRWGPVNLRDIQIVLQTIWEISERRRR